MLRLQKASRQDILSIIVRDKERLFTRSFVVAFIVALSIHLTFIILFQIAPITIGLNQKVFPPTRVETNVSIRESTVAELPLDSFSIRGLPARQPPHPSLATEPAFMPFRPLEHRILARSLVASSESVRALSEIIFNPLPVALENKTLMMITGPLSDYRLLSQDHPANMPSEMTAIRDPIRVIYGVMVDAATGKIFWFESLEEGIPHAIRQFAEGLLQKLTFAIDPKLVGVQGEIEWHFYPEAAS